MNTTTRGFTAFALACLALAACTPAQRAAERPQGAATPGLASGITSDNGGGARALNNNNNVGNITTTAPRPR